MTTQSEALRLADSLMMFGREDEALNRLADDNKRLRHSERESVAGCQVAAMQAAAELRRLYDINAQLLEALKRLVDKDLDRSVIQHWISMRDVDIAREAIAVAEYKA